MKTTIQPFTLLSGVQQQIPLMTKEAEHYLYHENENYQAIVMPFKGHFKFLVVLPKPGKFNMIDNLSVDEVINLCKGEKIEIHMPKFTQQSEMSLVEIYKQFGVTTLFHPNADMSGITEGGLFVSDILHKVVVAVDEFGVEAAAATAVVCCDECACMEDETPIKVMKVDHTFRFDILGPDGSQLFSGIMNGI
jgi:serpin B